MFINDKALADITDKDFQQLVNDKILESRTHDIKKDFDLINDKKKMDFLNDIASFANAYGGDIIYGISEKSGLPDIIEGIKTKKYEDMDKFKLELTSMIRAWIEPKVPIPDIQEYVIKDPSITPNPPALLVIIRIPKSWSSPHMVTYNTKGNERFATRGPAGKVYMDYTELKTSFLISESRFDKIKSFQNNRINDINHNPPAPIKTNCPKIILHAIPYNAFDPDTNFDALEIKRNLGKYQEISKYYIKWFSTVSCG